MQSVGFVIFLATVAPRRRRDFKMCHTLGLSWDAPDQCRPWQEKADLDPSVLPNDNWYGCKEALGNLKTVVETNDPRVKTGPRTHICTQKRCRRGTTTGQSQIMKRGRGSTAFHIVNEWPQQDRKSGNPQHDRPMTETDSENESAHECECEENDTAESDWCNEEWSEEIKTSGRKQQKHAAKGMERGEHSTNGRGR